MSGTTSVPSPTIDATGVHIPDESDVLAGVQADINAALGGGLNPSPATPQGQLATSFSAIIGDKNNQYLLLATQMDPAFASGRMQDGIGRLYFLTRNPALPTVVQCTCTGQQGTTIPVGALGKDTAGNIYICTQAGEIGAGGTVSLPFACQVTGPIQCATGALNYIYKGVPGWDTISNPSAGVVGQNVETRAAFELRRQNSVAVNSNGMLASILGSVLNVLNVIDAFVTDNSTVSPVTLDGVTVPAGAVYVCVSGGAALDIATAIWKKKPPGTPFAAGNTSQTIQDIYSGYNPPYPTYTMVWQTAAAAQVVVEVNMTNSLQVPSNALSLIQAAVQNAFSGNDGGTRARINNTLLASRFYAGIIALGPWARVISVKLGVSTSPDVKFTASISGTNMTVSAITSGALATGQTVEGAGVPAGTTIVSQTSGTAGNTGVYVVSSPVTASSEAMIAITGASDSVAIGAAHIPTLNVADIHLNLV